MKIVEPTLLIDRFKCIRNIEFMANKAKAKNLILRPHFKTHQSKDIAEWFRDYNIDRITVSSVKMAMYFVESGWRNITIAFPFNLLEIDRINQLAARIDLNLLIIHKESIEFLNHHLNNRVGIFVEIDCGSHRSGISADSITEIDDLMESIKKSQGIDFKGFLTHSGHVYHTSDSKQICAVNDVTNYKMSYLKQRYSSIFPDLICSVGDTPCCTVAEDFSQIDEIRPGNFVFYDLMQVKLKCCSWKQIALAVACPVVSINRKRNEIIIYGGAIHFSKEFICENGRQIFGLATQLTANGWSEPIDGFYLTSLTQEHGIIKVESGRNINFSLGGVLGILPVHSCLTANLMGSYKTFDGNVLDHMRSFSN
jgi:D-serine deaminase-like pyridoxal phosphate-dependent protein